jgi:hypothetical protein
MMGFLFNIYIMKAYFFDIDTILTVDNKVWLIDKSNPNIPLLKIDQSDFNLIKSGIFKSQGNKINFAGDSYWIHTELMNTIKIKCKNNKSDISNLAFSMQEFMNKELIENVDYDIDLQTIMHVKNSDDHIYFICSKNTKRNYELIIKKIEDKLRDNGLIIKNYYFISETFYNRNEDNVSHKKVRLLLQHLIGLKTEGDKFTSEEIEEYDEVYFYDDDISSIDLSNKSNDVLQILLSNTDTDIKSKIKDRLKSKEHILYVNQVTHNRANKFIQTKVLIGWSNIIKAFESFNWSK